jgi:2-amino-4-hydroxy-6-hydroxymethyldihydropteridine diphosphokinase
MRNIFLMLGTNLGDLQQNLECAVQSIERHGIKILKRSKLYKTKPWGVVEQPDFLNLALEVETELSGAELLMTLKKIEHEIGRRPNEQRWQSRKIDIDVLFMGDLVIDTEDLKVPHRQFFNRRFAVRILSEIAPDFRPPGTEKTLREHAGGEDDEGIQIYRN